MNAKARAVKTGAVLADLLKSRVFGTRPVSLSGFSLGSLVIFEVLKNLAQLPPAETAGIIQDVFIFGTPASTDQATWASIRRLVCGRLVNGYSKHDYILSYLFRASDATWNIAGLQPVDTVQGVENVDCKDVDGHLKWRGMIGSCLRDCNAASIISSEVDKQLATVQVEIDKEIAAGEAAAETK